MTDKGISKQRDKQTKIDKQTLSDQVSYHQRIRRASSPMIRIKHFSILFVPPIGHSCRISAGSTQLEVKLAVGRSFAVHLSFTVGHDPKNTEDIFLPFHFFWSLQATL